MNVVRQEPVCTEMLFLPSSLPMVFVCLCWHGSVCVSWTGPEHCLWVFVHADGRCHLGSWAATHAVLCQRDFALILLVFLSLREAGRELLLRAIALFAQEQQEKGQRAGHLSPSPNSSRSCCGASPRAAGMTCRSAALGWDTLQLQWLSQGLGFQWRIICQRWVSPGLCKEHLLQQ